MDKLKLYIYNLDEEIIELLSIRQELMTNSKNFKVLELGGYNMYDSLMKDIYKHICKTLTVEFNFNIFKKMEELYEEFPSYDI